MRIFLLFAIVKIFGKFSICVIKKRAGIEVQQLELFIPKLHINNLVHVDLISLFSFPSSRRRLRTLIFNHIHRSSLLFKPFFVFVQSGLVQFYRLDVNLFSEILNLHLFSKFFRLVDQKHAGFEVFDPFLHVEYLLVHIYRNLL